MSEDLDDVMRKARALKERAEREYREVVAWAADGGKPAPEQVLEIVRRTRRYREGAVKRGSEFTLFDQDVKLFQQRLSWAAQMKASLELQLELDAVVASIREIVADHAHQQARFQSEALLPLQIE